MAGDFVEDTTRVTGQLRSPDRPEALGTQGTDMHLFNDPLLASAPCPGSGLEPLRRRRPRPIVKAGIAAALLVGLPSVLVGGPSAASAVTPNLPVFPDNIVVFPNRDFISLEGFSDHAGEAGLIQVTRPGVGVVGSAIGTVSGTDVAFEVNHPGGICWGAGTGLMVTPDIQAGDVVSLSFGGAVAAATASLDVYANDAVQNGTTVTVTGHIGNTVDPANMEQRIIEPALVDTVIGKRDVRALPGPMTPAPKGGYSSGLEIDTATQIVRCHVHLRQRVRRLHRCQRRARRAGDGVGVHRP